MKSTRRSFLQTTAAVAVLPAPFIAGKARAADVTLRMHQLLPAQAAVPANTLIPWAAKVEKESDGRIKVDHFPSMQLGGKPPELADQVVDGVADIVWTLPGYTPGRFPRTEVFELPFTMTNAEATSKAYYELASETMFDQDFKDFHILGVWVHGPGLIHSKKPIKTVSDLNGVKLRAPTRVTNTLFKTLGATPIGMPVPAVPEALSKGVIDATVIPWEVTKPFKIAELVSNHTEFGSDSLYTATFIFAMNKARYESMPDDLRAVLDANSGLAFSGQAGKQMQIDDGPGRKAAVDRGNTIYTLTPDEVAGWKEASNNVADQWVEEVSAKGIDGAALRARAAELIAKHSA